jgi:metallophosphoesterase (TIGR00282 family)
MGEPGVRAVRTVLPGLKKEKSIDLVIAQGENVTEGRGISFEDFQKLRVMGIDFVTGGNWSHYRKDILPSLSDPIQPIIRPANYSADVPGLGYKFITTKNGEVLVISLLGKIVGKDADKPIDNPLQVIDRILEEQKSHQRLATIVNFHGDYSSEKRIIGYYLDGRVTAVVGDHWHVPTADAMVLPKGTAHITDVGMCGTLHSSLGVSLDSVIPRWRDSIINKNELETKGPLQFNATLIEVDAQTYVAHSIMHIQKILN